MITQIKIVVVICLVLASTGCEAFRKKFVRRAKEEKEVEVVIRTHEYESDYSQEAVYKKYFLFSKTAQEELIEALDGQETNRKRLVYLSEKIVENLRQLRKLVMPEKQKLLDGYIAEQDKLSRDLDNYYLRQASRLRIKNTLQKQKRKLQQEFAFQNIKSYLITR